MDRLEAVADVGQGARHDDAHRVVEVADPHLVLDADRSDVAQVVGHGRVTPVGSGGRGAWRGIRAGGSGWSSGRAGHRSGRRSRRRPRSTGRPAACGSRRGAARSSSAVGRVELGQRVADDPGAVAVVGRGGALGLVAKRRRRSPRGRRRVSERYAQDERLLDVRLGVAHQLAEERQRVAGDVRVAAAAPVDVGHRRDRRADEPALPARRAVDELLELGPAVRLGGDALAVRVGERVDGDPVAGLAGRAAQELPGPLGLGGERPLEEAEGEPARPRARSRGTAGRRRTGAASAGRRGSRSGSRARRPPAAASGRRGRRRCPGATRCWPGEVLGVGQVARGRRVSAVGEARRGRW